MNKFELVSKYRDSGLPLPVRKTASSAGYDFVVAENIMLYPYYWLERDARDYNIPREPKDLYEMADFTKDFGRPALVPTGVKCQLDPDCYLELSVRSSTPLKYWIILANGVGIIDADYYNNPDNEGEIFFQLINLSPVPIRLHKGDVIGQGIIKRYVTTEDDAATGKRVGGFGSTTTEPDDELGEWLEEVMHV